MEKYKACNPPLMSSNVIMKGYLHIKQLNELESCPELCWASVSSSVRAADSWGPSRSHIL